MMQVDEGGQGWDSKVIDVVPVADMERALSAKVGEGQG